MRARMLKEIQIEDGGPVKLNQHYRKQNHFWFHLMQTREKKTSSKTVKVSTQTTVRSLKTYRTTLLGCGSLVLEGNRPTAMTPCYRRFFHVRCLKKALNERWQCKLKGALINYHVYKAIEAKAKNIKLSL